MQLLKSVGLVGETAFVPRALLNKLFVVKPYGDLDPFDYMVGKLRPDWRVQVKTCATLDRYGMFHVCIGRKEYHPGTKRSVAYTPDETDFLPSTSCPRIAGISCLSKSPTGGWP